MDQDKRSTQAIDPALLDRARKAWPECDGGECYTFNAYVMGIPVGNFSGKNCDLHAAIARALEEYGDERLESALDELDVEMAMHDPETWSGVGEAWKCASTRIRALKVKP